MVGAENVQIAEAWRSYPGSATLKHFANSASVRSVKHPFAPLRGLAECFLWKKGWEKRNGDQDWSSMLSWQIVV